MGHNGLISDPFWALLGLEMGSFLTFRNPGNPEIPDSGPPDLWIAGSRSLDPSASHRADAVSRYVHTMVSIIPIHHGSKGHVWGCCGLYVYIYQQQKTPFWGVTKRDYGIQHNAIIPLAVVSGIPPGDIHHDGYQAGTIMAYGVRHMPPWHIQHMVLWVYA